jgi:hypothetical protein
MRRRSVTQRSLRSLFGAVVAGVALIAFGESVASAAGDEAAWLFDPGAVAEIDLQLPQASIDALALEPDEYQPATFTLKAGAATYGPYSVGARLKGSVGSFRPLTGKAGLKVKFDEYVDEQTFFGLEKLTLNNMVQDPSMVHETLTYALFRALDVPSPRTGYSFVRINGAAYGVYLNVETLDSISLPRWFASTRHLYEGQVGIDVLPGKELDFEVDEGKSKNREDLQALILAASDNVGDWSDGMAAVADLTEMTRMWAVERYVGHWDGYAGVGSDAHRPNNYYLHSEDTGLGAGRFQMLPWGTDQTWETRLEFDEQADGILFDRCMADDDCSVFYEDALRQIRASIAGLDLDAQAICAAERLQPWQAMEVAGRREHGPAEIKAGVEGTRAFIRERPGDLADWLGVASAEAAAPLERCSSSDPAQAAAVPSAGVATPAPKLQLSRAAVKKGVLATRLQVSSAGRLNLRATIRTRNGRVTACTGTAAAAAAGPVSVRCKLSAAVHRRLRGRWLKFHLEASVKPPAGPPTMVYDVVTVPRVGAESGRHRAA